jgi:hypothetical protein
MSGVVLGNNNITIGGKILETFKSVGNIGLEGDFPTFDNDTFVEPVIHFFPDVLPYVAPINIPGTGFAYVALVNTGATQTSYTMNFQENTECDILIVGGGGGGGNDRGGGGGAGGLIFNQNLILNGTYNILVGAGGISNTTENSVGDNGNNSSFGVFIALGGGGGAGEGALARSGGSGGGMSYAGNTFGSGLQPTSLSGGFGNSGGDSRTNNQLGNKQRGGGGGGGAGQSGERSTSTTVGGKGGDGLSGIGSIDFKTFFTLESNSSIGEYLANEDKIYFAGGGGSGECIDGTPEPSPHGIGGKGGGGDGKTNSNIIESPLNNSGGGGGGGGSPSYIGGNGGSGIVIIRFRTMRVIPIIMLASDPIPYSIISTIDSNYKYAFFANTGGNPTVYNIDFKQPTECDVLIIGGGGGGGMDRGGGGGAGGFIKLNNQYFNGLYIVNVGKGGDGAPAGGTNGQPADHPFNINAKNGGNSQFGNNIAIGGGFGGSSRLTDPLGARGSSGGSGGGSGVSATNDINAGGTGTLGQGNRGGLSPGGGFTGGGGGAGSIGGGHPLFVPMGGFGIYSDITGEGYYWAGGGGGSGNGTSFGGNGGLGGGGGGAVGITFGGVGYNNGDQGGGQLSFVSDANRPGGNGGQHTGGGGGGGSDYNINNKGGDGGSGVVIIRYRYNKKLLSIRIDTDYNYFALYNAGDNQTQYNITFPKQTECDILIVGGGGAGGRFGGGGGAGSVLFKSQIVIVGNCTINVGRGGIGHNIFSQIGGNGQQSTITINGVNYIADGGGGGGSRQESQSAGPQNGASGGSGGGGSHSNTGTGAIGGVTTKTSYTYSGWETNGFNGGNGRPNTSGGNPNHASGGGGGAGGLGQNWDSTGGGNGGLAKEYISVFGSGVGHNGYFGGGGGGNTYASAGDVGFANGGNGLFGGGGNGGFDGGTELPGADALGGTGGGGGGSKYDGGTAEDTDGGDGGSGIVIIRYKIIKTNFDAQWTYNSTNPSVYHIGNVGIGKTNPTSALSVVGSVSITGEYLARTKTFKIEHPLNMNKWLYHGCVEAPRFDNMYRGKKRITNGKCEVDIDKECNDTGGMTDGTFDALNADSQLYLQNTNTFDAVKGSIIDGKIIIICENTIDDIDVDWLVIGERQDENIIGNRLTNDMGNLICEHNVN